MSHRVRHTPAPLRVEGLPLRIHQVPAAQSNLVWLLEDEGSGEVFAVDGPSAKPALDYCNKRGLQLAGILNTHTHGDHIGINRDLVGHEAKWGCRKPLRVVAPKSRVHEIPGVTEAVEEGDEVSIGHARAQVWLTEGHLNGHVSYVFSGALFCGDTLFTGGCGYLFDGPPEAMQRSLARLAELPDETLVCCAHDYTEDNLRFALTLEPNNAALLARMADVLERRQRGESCVPARIDVEKATNPFLRWSSPELQSNLHRQFPAASLDAPEAIFAATRALKDHGDYRR